VAVSGHKLILEDGSEIQDEENIEDDYGQNIPSGLFPQAKPIEQARLQALRNNEGRPGGPDTESGPQFNITLCLFRMWGTGIGVSWPKGMDSGRRP
jgi:hypothetical protein